MMPSAASAMVDPSVAHAAWKPTYLSSLTPIRGLLAMWIVAFHFNEIVPILPAAVSREIRRSYLAVDFFFIMSGFVICHVYGRALSSNPSWPAIAAYVRARFARIYPLHLFWLCTHILVFLLAVQFAPPVLSQSEGFKQLYNVRAIPTHLLMLHAMGIHGYRTWDGPSWSIGAEWWTYLIAIPVLVWMFRGSKWRMALTALIGFLGFVALQKVGHKATMDYTYDWGFVRCLSGFLIGVPLHEAYERPASAAVLQSDAMFLGVLALTAGLLHVEADDLVMLPMVALIVLVAASNRGMMRRILELRPLRYLGEISYSVYMCQSLALMLIMVPFAAATGLLSGEPHLPGRAGLALWYVGLLAFAGAIGATTYRYVEVPMRRWIHRRFD